MNLRQFCCVNNYFNIFKRYSSFKSSPMVGDLSQYKTNYETTNDPKEWASVEKLLKSKIIPIPKSKEEYPSGWIPPNLDLAKKWPYFVQRSPNCMLPVYLTLKYRGTLKITEIKNIEGNIWELEKELREFLEKKHKKYLIISHVNELVGRVIFRGDFVNDVKDYFLKKGF